MFHVQGSTKEMQMALELAGKKSGQMGLTHTATLQNWYPDQAFIPSKETWNNGMKSGLLILFLTFTCTLDTSFQMQ